MKKWKTYLENALNKKQTANKTRRGGTVHINFTVGSDGVVQDIYVSKSVEYFLDNDAIEIIANSPKWQPAYQNGKNVRAYRKQPLTFATNVEP